jgi:hypothetical protein
LLLLDNQRVVFLWLKKCIKSVKKLAEKFGSLKIKRTFALPFEKRVADKGQEFLPRLTLKKILKIFAKKFGD